MIISVRVARYLASAIRDTSTDARGTSIYIKMLSADRQQALADVSGNAIGRDPPSIDATPETTRSFWFAMAESFRINSRSLLPSHALGFVEVGKRLLLARQVWHHAVFTQFQHRRG